MICILSYTHTPTQTYLHPLTHLHTSRFLGIIITTPGRSRNPANPLFTRTIFITSCQVPSGVVPNKETVSRFL
jgi:hypothetical protein